MAVNSGEEIALMAHLFRRAGFGATYEQLEEYAAKGYEETVEELLHPEAQPDIPMDLVDRYFMDYKEMVALETNQIYWAYRMTNTQRPLEEKIALFWHGIFCAGNAKVENSINLYHQLNKFRGDGLGRLPVLLTDLATNPAMIYYLDNQMSHKKAINENWGRELLELFSMGVGMDGHPNYSEDDVKACAQAFTGWTVGNAVPRYPYGLYSNYFYYNPQDHDVSERSFLGEKGSFNGEDVIDIICRQPATARFISRHMYNFFVADEPQVPLWPNTPPGDMAAIKLLEDEYFRSGYEIRAMLRVLFNSESFKNERFSRMKSPTEVVIGTLRLVGSFNGPKLGLYPMALQIRYMGQDLLNPPTVEGWHTGQEWIDSGTLLERVNFTAEQVGNVNHPGVRNMIDRLRAQGTNLSHDELLDRCLEMLGWYRLTQHNRDQILGHLRSGGPIRTRADDFPQRVGRVLQLVVAAQEYQFA